MTRTWLITGTSSGMGRELTERLLERGERVVATLRRAGRLSELASRYPETLWVKELDVTDDNQIGKVVAEAFAELGRIDVVVSNAGYGVFGAAEELTDDDVVGMLATNLTGSIRLARAVTPHLRRQGGGLIMQMSSMGGHVSFPGFALYNSSKWGVEGFFEAFTHEVEPFGIRTILIEPGVVRTPFFDAAGRTDVLPGYADHPAIGRGDIALEDMPDDQGKVVQAMIDAADLPEPPKRMLLGTDAYELVTDALRNRLAEAEAQREHAAVADAG
jgi:NAD(P)-dependent dehydrogenase (short-subunit alcohol dehydrogenase family)